MSTLTPPETSLLTEAIAAARAGDNEEARRLLRRITEEEPGNVEAWVWRASVAENPADKKAFLEEALTLEPGNIEARRALERVQELEGARIMPLGEDETLFCTVHPDRETMLRCNRCGRPMCTSCAVQHPVGLRCRECVNDLRSPIYKPSLGATAQAFLTSLVLAVPIGLIVLLFGGVIGIFFWIFIGGAVGTAVANLLQRFLPRKRGRTMQVAVGLGLILGTLLAAAGLLGVTNGVAGLLALPGFIFRQLHVLIYLVITVIASTAALR